ncbi:MAG: serine protease [Deltaproteobacteria bacterium]|nr:serine protease [Deltaproteobacteria bacterium]
MSIYARHIYPEGGQGLKQCLRRPTAWVFVLALILSLLLSTDSLAVSPSLSCPSISAGPNSGVNKFTESRRIWQGLTNLAQIETKQSTLKMETPVEPPATTLEGASVGTGWPIVDGYVVTSNHVVAGYHDLVVISRLGEELPARLALRDQVKDVAILEVSDVRKLPPALPLATKKARLGTAVFTIGFPRVDYMGRSPKLFTGVISSVNGLHDDPTSYHTTVPIQPGNSGGPLLNMNGEVVGLVTSMLGLRDEEDGEISILPNASCVLKISSVEKLFPLLPKRDPAIEVLPRDSGSLETLAERIQGSILLVVAK